MLDLGIVKPGTTLYIPFHTFDSNDPSASVTITGLATTDIEIYKDGSATQRASDAGYSLLDTDGIDFDTTTGIHGISIDLSNNTTAEFYQSGHQYWVVIASITVDAATVNFVAATFRIGYPDAVLNTHIDTLSSQTSFTLPSGVGPGDNDALNGCRVCIHDLASAVQIAFGVVSDYVGSTRTVTLKADPGIFTMAAGDNIAFYAPALTATSPGSTLDVTATGAAGIDWGNVENPTTAVDLSATDIQLADTTTTVTNDVGVNEWNGVSLGTTNPLPNAAAGAAGGLPTDSAGKTSFNDLSAAQVNTEVDTALSDIDLDHLVNSALPTSWAVDVAAGSVFDQIADDGTAVYDRTTDSLQAIADSGGGGPTAAQIADAVWDEAQADHVAAGSFGVTATEIADILTDTNELQADWVNGGRLDLILDATATASALATAQADLDIITGTTGVVIEDGSITDASFSTTAGDFHSLGVIDQGTAQAVTDTTIRLRSAAAFADSELIGAVVLITSATTGVGQARTITAYASATDTATVDTWTTTPTGGTITYKVFASPPAPVTPADVNVTQVAGQTATAAATVDFDDLAAILVDTAEIGTAGAGLTNINLPNQTMDIVGNITGNLSGSVGSVTGAVGSVTGNVGGNVTGSVGSNLELGPSEVNAEVVDALNTDTYAEPGQGAPAATASLVAKIGYLYKAWRNRSTQTATTYSLYNDDATTVDHKSTVSDDGTTADKGEVATGP